MGLDILPGGSGVGEGEEWRRGGDRGGDVVRTAAQSDVMEMLGIDIDRGHDTPLLSAALGINFWGCRLCTSV